MKKEKKDPPRPKSQKRTPVDKAVSIRVPVDAYKSLKTLASEHDMSINSLLNFYIQQIISQENDEVNILGREDDSIVEIEKMESLAQERNLPESNFGIKRDRIEISSASFVGNYFRSFSAAVIVCLVIPLLVWLVFHYLAVVIVPWLLSVIWALLCIVVGITSRNDRTHLLISGMGWLVGTLSIIIVVLSYWYILGRYSYRMNEAQKLLNNLLVLLFGIVLLGLLVNIPIELNNAFINRRAKKINEHINEWGETICKNIVSREIQPDMTRDMVLLAWGKPTVIESQEATKDSFAEKWVYSATPKSFYVWFTNGAVNKINDTGT